MGWFRSDAGLNGDEPAGAFGEAMRAIQNAAAAPPSVEELIASLIVAMNCDGQREQFFQGKHRVAALRIHLGDTEVHITGDSPRPDVVNAMYHALDAASEAYRESFGRPPTVSEVLQYLRIYLTPEYSDGFVNNPGPWKLIGAVLVRSKKLKSADRLPCPIADVADTAPLPKVLHRKFGTGVITRDFGATVEVLFDDGQHRLIQRTFLVLDGPG